MEARRLMEYFPSLNEETGEICLTYHSNLVILSKEETKKVIAGLQKFVDNAFTDGDIEAHNERVYKEELIRMYGTDEIPEYHTRPVRSKRERISSAKVERGFVYLIKNPRNGLHKIGRSKDVEFRLSTLAEEHGPLELISHHEFNDYKFAERLLHEHYGDKRVTGEWFCLSEEDVNYISDWKFSSGETFEINMSQALVAEGELYVQG